MSNSTITIITHDGVFHADEVMAVAIVSYFEPAADITVVRTRDTDTFSSADFVFDIGGIYEPKKGLFDHHQKNGAGVRRNGIPYATSGLVWNFFGSNLGLKISEDVDQVLMEAIDAIDTGCLIPDTCEFHFSQYISGYNRVEDGSMAQHEAFYKAVAVSLECLDNTIKKCAEKVAAEKIVDKAAKTSTQGILILEKFVPWQDAVKENHPTIQRVIFPDAMGNGFRVQVVEGTSYLPEEWRGLRDEELDLVTGIQGGVFVHPAGFICGHTTYEGALALAKASLPEA